MSLSLDVTPYISTVGYAYSFTPVSSTEKRPITCLSEDFPLFDEIIKSIPQFEGDLSVKLLDVGVGNNVFHVLNNSSGKSFALKIFTTKEFEKIAKTYRFFDEIRPLLSKNEINTPDTVIFPRLVGENIVMVNEFLKGKHITDDYLPATAAIMAKLHSISIEEKSYFPQRPSIPNPEMRVYFEKCVDWEYCATLKEIWNTLDLSYMQSLPRGQIHGDFSYSNVLVDEDRQISLIDCDQMSFGSFLDDIASSQIFYGFDDDSQFKRDVFSSFIKAYQEIRPLTLIEKTHLITDVKRRLIELALASYYYLYVVQDPITGIVGDPKCLARIIKKENHYLYPDFIARNVVSLEALKEDAWREID